MKVGTFFSGVGSPEQALRNLDIKHEIEFACDIDKYAKQTYLKNFKPKLFAEDITTLDMKNLPYVDLLVFGFPCQAFSMAGKRKGFDDTRGTLFYDALRYLKEHKPRYFIAENVKGLLSHDNSKTFQTIIDCLAKTTNYQMSLMPFENLDYHIHYKVLNTKDFGIPQNRERIFIIGIRDDEDNNFNFPKEIPLELKLKDILQDNVNKKYYLSEEQYKKINISNETKGLELRKDNLANSITTHEHDSILWIADYRTDEGLRIRKDNNSPCLTAGNRANSTGSTPVPIISKTNRVIEKIGKINNSQSGAIYSDKGLSTTLSANGGGQGAKTGLYKTNNRIRRLTPIECERLQGFPDNFTEEVSDTQRYKQMGNTISVPVIQAIIKKLIG